MSSYRGVHYKKERGPVSFGFFRRGAHRLEEDTCGQEVSRPLTQASPNKQIAREGAPRTLEGQGVLWPQVCRGRSILWESEPLGTSTSWCEVWSLQ